MAIYNNAVFIVTIPGDHPRKVTLQYYRGDSDSFVFICRESDNETPFNIGVADSFRCQIRDADDNLVAELDPNTDFVLGQSNECIQYLTDNNLASDAIKDELHCMLTPTLLQDVELGTLFTDVEFHVGTDTYTIGKAKIKMTKDITK